MRACVFDGAAGKLSMAIEGTDAVEFDLSTPHVQARRAAAESGELARDRRAQLEGWRVESVDAPIDDRRISIELIRAGRFKGSAERRATLTVSAVPNARGAELRERGGHLLATLGARVPTPSEPRPIPDPAELTRAAREGDESALLRARWMSAAAAKWLISDPELAAQRYLLFASDAPPEPSMCGTMTLPFPMCADAVAVESLIASPPEDAGRRGEPVPAASPRARGARDRRERALERMRGELARAREAPRFRAIADALKLLGDQKPPVEVELADGEHTRVPSKPGESAGDVAERLYAAARSMERALESLPARMLALSHETERSAATVGAQATRHAERPDASEEGSSRSYRSYRSTTGLEIRVGRGARANEELTFRESSPNDIWLHARESAGAHVVLRWTSAESPPPPALEEAAILAALHSKSRGAALVPVDWTRRKYVRRARGAPPGTVLVQRARTMMVKPDPLLEKKLRAR